MNHKIFARLLSGVATIVGLCCQSAMADPQVVIEDPVGPRDTLLKSNGFIMEGVGLRSSISCLERRLNYAATHDWLNASELQTLTDEFQAIVDCTDASRQSQDGKLTQEQMQASAKAIAKLNERFEVAVLSAETLTGKDAIVAQSSFLKNQVIAALRHGVISTARAHDYNEQLQYIADSLQAQQLTGKNIKIAGTHLNKIASSFARETRTPQLAVKGVLKIGKTAM